MYQIIREGLTEIRIPVTEHPEGHPDVPLASSAVFYNPEMELNRDLNVIMTAAAARLLTEKKGYEKETFSYIDAFSASGIRGLRVAKELGIPVVLNDRKEEAAEMIRENVEINGLEKLSTVTCRDANSLLSDSRATFVDIDPFGTPSPFLDAAVSSASYYLGVTATDTAPLCGAHMKSGMRKYAAVPINNEFHSEMGLRILLGSIAREAARFEKGIHVLFSHATRHYVRCYIEMKHGVAQADRTVRELGFLAWCPKCGAREMKHGINRFPTDKDEYLNCIAEHCKEVGADYAPSDVFCSGGEGGIKLAEKVIETLETKKANYKPLYQLEGTLKSKIEAVAKNIYGAAAVEYSAKANKMLQRLEETGYGNLPVCIAKTQASISDDPKKKGAPTGWTLMVREVNISGGAGFVVPVCGEMTLMPGLAKIPAAVRMDIDKNGRITGLK